MIHAISSSSSLQTSARLDAVEIAVDVDLQQDGEVVTRPASIGWLRHRGDTPSHITSSVMNDLGDFALDE